MTLQSSETASPATDGAAPAATGGGAAPAETAAPARPDYLPEAFWDATAGAPKVEDLARGYAELSTREAERAKALEGFPAKLDDYAVDLSGLKLPDGMKFDLATDDPLYGALRQVAFEAKVPPGQLAPLMQAFVDRELAFLEAGNKAIAEAHAKLGEKAGERIGAVESWLKANGLDAFTDTLHTATADKAVAQWEAHIAKMNKAIPATGAQSSAGLSEDEYNRMSPAERLAHARRTAAKN